MSLLPITLIALGACTAADSDPGDVPDPGGVPDTGDVPDPGDVPSEVDSVLDAQIEPRIDVDAGDAPVADAACPDRNSAGGAEEQCDGVDNDCDGDVDEGLTTVFYRDADGDGFGLKDDTVDACTRPDGYVEDTSDCDDTDPKNERCWVSLVLGGEFTCGLTISDEIECWGRNAHGLALPGQATPPEGKFRSIASAKQNSCGVRMDGTLACWGRNQVGESSPPEGSNYRSLTTGSLHSCALTTDDKAVCWGYDFKENGVLEAPEDQFESVSARGYHTCGLKKDGTVTCWGSDDYGESSPLSGSFEQLGVGSWFGCGLRSAGDD